MDLDRYSTEQLKVNVPTLVFHGTNDEVVPFAGSVKFAQANEQPEGRRQVKLIELNDGHELIAPLDSIWATTHSFLVEQSLLPVSVEK